MNNNHATKSSHTTENRASSGQQRTLNQHNLQYNIPPHVKSRVLQSVEERPRKSYHNDGPGGNYQGF